MLFISPLKPLTWARPVNPGFTVWRSINFLISLRYCSVCSSICGRGPTTDISPFKTLINWGSSSMLNFLNILPKGVIRQSPFVACFLSASAFFRMDRYLIHEKTFPSIRVRFCLKKTSSREPKNEAMYNIAVSQGRTVSMIINAIKIARIVKHKIFLDSISALLRHELFNKHSDIFISIVNIYPAFVVNLIEVMPEIFSDGPDMVNLFHFEKRIRYIKPQNLLDYIRIIRFLHSNNESKKINRNVSDSLQYLERIISESNYFLGINLKGLTIDQLSDLLWYAKATNNLKLLSRVQILFSSLIMLP